ncbi:MAG: DUF6508 domain-containing protein [Acidimicrobiia bacterium]
MLAELSDEEIERRLRASPDERWNSFWEASAAVEAETEHGRWDGPPGHMPYVTYSDAVTRWMASFYGLGASEPFDWMAWGGLNRYRGGQGLDEAPVAEAVRLVMAVSRADRFGEGTLLNAFDSGTMAAVVRRLRRWRLTGR